MSPSGWLSAAAFVFFPLIDMVFFGGFLAAAIVYRKVPHLHKRAMFLATFSMAIVGLGRLVGRMPFESAWIWQPLNLAPLLVALAYDLYVCRKVYWVMAAGLLVQRSGCIVGITTTCGVTTGTEKIFPYVLSMTLFLRLYPKMSWLRQMYRVRHSNVKAQSNRLHR